MNAEIVEVIVSFLAPGKDVWPADPRTIDVEESTDLYMDPASFFSDRRPEAKPMSEMTEWLEEVWVPSAWALMELAATDRQFMKPCMVYLKVMHWLENDIGISMIMEMAYKWCEVSLDNLPLSENEFVDRAMHFWRQNTFEDLRNILSSIDAGLRSGTMDKYDVYADLWPAKKDQLLYPDDAWSDRSDGGVSE